MPVQHEVLRLDVPVQHTVRAQMRDDLHHLRREGAGLGEGQGALRLDALKQLAAPERLQAQVEAPIVLRW